VKYFLIIFTIFTFYGKADEKISFNDQILPILSDKCFFCHGPDEKKRKGKLRLDTFEGAIKIKKGKSAVVPGSPEKSQLLFRILHDDEDEIMPPPDSDLRLTSKEKKLIEQWIKEGAGWETHWAFNPVQKQNIPQIAEKTGNGIDNFVFKRLAKESMTFSPETDPNTLIRRLSLDLTGLPPTPEQVDNFLNDKSKNAYGKVVDRLLKSNDYAEHMSSWWLDGARYADTDGYQNDRYRYHHVWRDWVIQSFQSNQPFDQFVIEQLAGDMLPNATLKQQIATGFGRNHRINSEAGSIPEEWQTEYVADRVDTFGTLFLGMTMGCARCHDHKYDPITQKDYYQLFAFFNNVPEFGTGPNNGNSPPYIKIPKSWPKLKAEENKLIVPAALKWQKDGKFAGGVRRPVPGKPDTLMVMHEMKKPRDTYLLERGVYNMPDKSEKLSPSVPAILDTVPGLKPKNRLELAKWLTHSKNPLFARVMVNRIWQQYFGTGFIATSENLGTQGERPSHPELLDWLATEFINSNWNLHHLHKLIVTSRTYKQSSVMTPESVEKDPKNRLMARGARFRLHAFSIRDQALIASGLLTRKIGGPSTKPYMPKNIWKAFSNNKYVQDKGDKLYRRSLYTYWRRTIPPPTMMNFNAAEREVCEVRKDKTNTPLQALTLMNNITFIEAARFLAERTLKEGGQSVKEQINYAYRLSLGRNASANELQVMMEGFKFFKSDFAQRTGEAHKLLQIGEKPRDKNLDITTHAAMTMLASSILNLDEMITRE
jgi:hypothetical protein